MATGYTRQSAAQIVTGNVINASDFNNEYNQLQSAFDVTAGHTHDGSTTGGGAPISYTNLTNKPTLGTAASHDISFFNQTANNLSDVVSVSTARTNLGLGTSATLNVGTSANNILQLNGSAQIPAVDGSLITNLSASQLAGMLPSQGGNNGKFLTTNGSSVSWGFLPTSGASVTDPMNSNITLVNSSATLQTFNPQSQGLNINLPAANTIPNTGGPYFLLRNKGLWYVWILDNSGTIVGVSTPGSNTSVYLENNGSAAGTWRFTSGDSTGDATGIYQGSLISPVNLSSSAVSTGGQTISCQLSPVNSLHMIVSSSTTFTIAGVVETSTGLVTDAATTVNQTITSGSAVDMVALTSTTALIVYNTSSNLTAVVATLNTITGTVTLGTPQTVAATNPFDVFLSVLSSTSVVLFYSSTNIINSVVLSISGTTVTVNSNSTKSISNNIAHSYQAVALSSSLIHLYYTDIVDGFCCVRITISGTTITFGTRLVIDATTTKRGVYSGKVSSTLSCVLYCTLTANHNGNGSVSGICITDTGTTITAGTTYNNLLNFLFYSGGSSAIGNTANLINISGSKFVACFNIQSSNAAATGTSAGLLALVSLNITGGGVISTNSIKISAPFGVMYTSRNQIVSVKSYANNLSVLFNAIYANSTPSNEVCVVPYYCTNI